MFPPSPPPLAVESTFSGANRSQVTCAILGALLVRNSPSKLGNVDFCLAGLTPRAARNDRFCEALAAKLGTSIALHLLL